MTDRDEILRLAAVAEKEGDIAQAHYRATVGRDLATIATLLRELAETRGKEQA